MTLTATPDVIARCFEEHGGRMYRAALAIVRNPHDAEDAVQTAAARALAAVETFRGEASTCTWIHRIVINASTDQVRRRRREGQSVDDDAVDALWADPHFSVDPALVAGALDDRRRLDAALDRLSDAQRQVVLLHDAEDWTVAEIARTVDLPLATVKSHLRRGRQALVGMLGARP